MTERPPNAPVERTVLYAADSHRLLREIAGRFENRIFDLGVRWLGYEPRALARRLTQKWLAEVTVPFRKEFKRLGAARNATSTLVQRRFPLNEFGIDGATGEVTITRTAAAKWICVFLAYWFFIFGVACGALRLKKASPALAGTLLHGVGHENLARLGDDASFLDFVRHGAITVLSDARALFVQAIQPVVSTDPARVSYSRYPVLALLRRRGMTPRELASFAVWHARSAAVFLRAVSELRIACLLARDFAFNAAAVCLDRVRALDAVVLTGSNFHEQMLWMSDLPGRRYGSHMVFYSVNGNPFVYKAYTAYEHNPSLSYIRVDEFWVWTVGQAQVVREWGLDAKCNVAGPILFCRPAQPRPPRHDELQIVVFDITPMEPEVIERFGVINAYYITEHAIAFLRDVLDARDAAAAELGRSVTLVVKPKRKYQRVHSTNYIDFLLARAANDPQFRILDPDTDLVEVIGSSDCVITMPYSSPPYIAVELGVPSIYYDPSDTLLPSHEPHPLIAFASTPRALERAVADALSGAAQRAARRVAAN